MQFEDFFLERKKNRDNILHLTQNSEIKYHHFRCRISKVKSSSL